MAQTKTTKTKTKTKPKSAQSGTKSKAAPAASKPKTKAATAAAAPDSKAKSNSKAAGPTAATKVRTKTKTAGSEKPKNDSIPPTSTRTENSRTNNATRASVDRTKLFAEGTFKLVYAGKYTEGARNGEKCVAKEFKTGSVYERDYFAQELVIIGRTQAIVDAWHEARVIDRRVLLNTPAIWRYERGDMLTLVEPMIDRFEKFNSNTGWATTTGGPWSEPMQALSHFSYHHSGGRQLLCDLQGACYSNGYILSDPVIMSEAQDCGPADLGVEGIETFFARHRCNQFCSADWDLPQLANEVVMPLRQGTTMIEPAHLLPTRQSRPPLTSIQED